MRPVPIRFLYQVDFINAAFAFGESFSIFHQPFEVEKINVKSGSSLPAVLSLRNERFQNHLELANWKLRENLIL